MSLIFTGQNKMQDLPRLPCRTYRARPLDWDTLKQYLYTHLPIDPGDADIEERLEKLRPALSTVQQVHDLCVPHMGKPRLHPGAIPDNETRVLHDYMHAWCAKEKIHKAVCGASAYSSSQESGVPYGELLLGQLAQLCWTMSQTNEYYVDQNVLRQQLQLVLWEGGSDTPTLGCSYLSDAERDQILSLNWCGVLFELDGREMHIRHESYRDYLAAEYIAGLCNPYTEKGFPAILMQPIPDRILRCLLPMLNTDTLQRLCQRIRSEARIRGLLFIVQYFADIFDIVLKSRNLSDLRRDNLIQAGSTMFRLVRATPLSRWTRYRMIHGMPYHPALLFRKEDL